MAGKQGFASMDKDKHREIARIGGKTAHQLGRAHKWTSEEARAAGRRGGQAKAAKGTVTKTFETMTR